MNIDKESATQCHQSNKHHQNTNSQMTTKTSSSQYLKHTIQKKGPYLTLPCLVTVPKILWVQWRTMLYPFRSQNIVNLHTSRNVNKTPTIANLGDAYVRSAVWLRVCLVSQSQLTLFLVTTICCCYRQNGCLYFESLRYFLLFVRAFKMKGVIGMAQNM